LPQQSKAFWLACQKHNVEITISAYPIRIDREAVADLASKHNITLTYSELKDNAMYNLAFDLRGKQNYVKNYVDCWEGNMCVALQNGKLYTCPVIPTSKWFNLAFGKYLEVTDKDFIDIYKAKNLDEILDFLRSPVPFCRYCTVNEQKPVHKWRPSKKEITEWAKEPLCHDK
jgi:hypothetical protein